MELGIGKRIAWFAGIGTAAYLVDVAVLTMVEGALGLYLGRGVSYFCGVTFAFLCNRRFTFVGRARGGWLRQYGLYLLAYLFGGVVNYGVYAALITFATGLGAEPFVAVGAGSLAGMAVNFTLSDRIVFRARGAERPAAD